MLQQLNNELLIILPMALKIIVATICGAIVGWEREKKNKDKRWKN